MTVRPSRTGNFSNRIQTAKSRAHLYLPLYPSYKSAGAACVRMYGLPFAASSTLSGSLSRYSKISCRTVFFMRFRWSCVTCPQSLFAFIVGSRAVLIRWDWVVKCIHHHQFVVAQKHVGIWHRHDPAEDPDAVRIPIDHVAEDIERVLSPQADLPHDRIKPPLLPMDIRHDIDHGVSPPSSQHK